LRDLGAGQAPAVLARLHGFAPVNAPVFREILRQAQFGVFTTVILINEAFILYADFPWWYLIRPGGILAAEYASYQVDANAVNLDAWAVYNGVKPQGNMRYRHLSYISAQLHIQIGNHRSRTSKGKSF